MTNEKCACGNRPDHFIDKDDGTTVYFCDNCLDFETIQSVIDVLGLELEVGVYDGYCEKPEDCNEIYLGNCIGCPHTQKQDSPSVVTEQPMTTDEKNPNSDSTKICKHWQNGLCTEGEARGLVDEDTGCGGMLDSCKVPRYQVGAERP